MYFWDSDIISKEFYTHQVSGSPDLVDVIVRDHCNNQSNGVVQINNKPVELEEILDAFLCGPGQSVVVDVNALIPNYPDYTIEGRCVRKMESDRDLAQVTGRTQ